MVRRNVRAPRGVCWFDAEKTEVLEEAVALEHGGIDRREGRAVGEEIHARGAGRRADPTTRRD